LRTIIAWVFAFAAFAVISIAAAFVGGRLGVPVSLNVDPYTVDYGMYGEVERDSITTMYGWGVYALAVLASVEIWHRIMGKQLSPTARAQFNGWLLGATMMTVGGIPLFGLFNHTEGFAAVIGNVLNLGLLGASIYVGVRLARHLQSQHLTQAE
jgi:hypothetical protein